MRIFRGTTDVFLRIKSYIGDYRFLKTFSTPGTPNKRSENAVGMIFWS